MKLEYSLHVIPFLWQQNELPIPNMSDGSVLVEISGSTWDKLIPPYFSTGDLMVSKRPSGEAAVTLLLTTLVGCTPPSHKPKAVAQKGEWREVAIFGQIRITLTSEAIALIRKSEGDECDYQLALADVQFIDKTPTF